MATMTTNEERRSATIIEFPVSGRATGGGRRDEMKSAGHHELPRHAMVACGGAWYHEAAMREEAERSNNG